MSTIGVVDSGKLRSLFIDLNYDRPQSRWVREQFLNTRHDFRNFHSRLASSIHVDDPLVRVFTAERVACLSDLHHRALHGDLTQSQGTAPKPG